MTADQLQTECERGQAQLMRMEYLQAETTLAAAEQIAWEAQDWDCLARLYMPLQEARRQRRQRCGEGIVCLDLLAADPRDTLDAIHVLKNFSHGQLLVAGWGSIVPAGDVRGLAGELGLYVETFLAAVFPVDEGTVIAIIPTLDTRLPDPIPRPVDQLIRQLPAHSLLFREEELPHGSRRGTYQTFGQVMAIWERLHAPFLAEADAQTDLVLKMQGYRRTIAVDYACELAHQKLSAAAHEMLRLAKVPS